jgi:hypothetical protein
MVDADPALPFETFPPFVVKSSGFVSITYFFKEA